MKRRPVLETLNLELREIIRLSEDVLERGAQAVDPAGHMAGRDLLVYHYRAAVDACVALQMAPEAALLAECQALTQATLDSLPSGDAASSSARQDTPDRLRRVLSQIMSTASLRGFPHMARQQRREQTLVS